MEKDRDNEGLPPDESDEAPPPFAPDPNLIVHFERGTKPSELEVRRIAEATRR